MSSELDRVAAKKATITATGMVTFVLALYHWPILWTILKVTGILGGLWLILYLAFHNDMFTSGSEPGEGTEYPGPS